MKTSPPPTPSLSPARRRTLWITSTLWKSLGVAGVGVIALGCLLGALAQEPWGARAHELRNLLLFYPNVLVQPLAPRSGEPALAATMAAAWTLFALGLSALWLWVWDRPWVREADRRLGARLAPWTSADPLLVAGGALCPWLVFGAGCLEAWAPLEVPRGGGWLVGGLVVAASLPGAVGARYLGTAWWPARLRPSLPTPSPWVRAGFVGLTLALFAGRTAGDLPERSLRQQVFQSFPYEHTVNAFDQWPTPQPRQLLAAYPQWPSLKRLHLDQLLYHGDFPAAWAFQATLEDPGAAIPGERPVQTRHRRERLAEGEAFRAFFERPASGWEPRDPAAFRRAVLAEVTSGSGLGYGLALQDFWRSLGETIQAEPEAPGPRILAWQMASTRVKAIAWMLQQERQPHDDPSPDWLMKATPPPDSVTELELGVHVLFAARALLRPLEAHPRWGAWAQAAAGYVPRELAAELQLTALPLAPGRARRGPPPALDQPLGSLLATSGRDPGPEGMIESATLEATIDGPEDLAWDPRRPGQAGPRIDLDASLRWIEALTPETTRRAYCEEKSRQAGGNPRLLSEVFLTWKYRIDEQSECADPPRPARRRGRRGRRAERSSWLGPQTPRRDQRRR